MAVLAADKTLPLSLGHRDSILAQLAVQPRRLPLQRLMVAPEGSQDWRAQAVSASGLTIWAQSLPLDTVHDLGAAPVANPLHALCSTVRLLPGQPYSL